MHLWNSLGFFRVLFASLETVAWYAFQGAFFLDVGVVPSAIMGFQIKICTVHATRHVFHTSPTFQIFQTLSKLGTNAENHAFQNTPLT